MGTSYCEVSYKYTASINLTSIVESIIDKMLGENDDWELDGDTLYLYQRCTTNAECWHCNATLESPAEDEVELADDIEEYPLDKKIFEALQSIKKENISFSVEKDDESSWDWHDEEPDPWDDGRYSRCRRFDDDYDD